HTFWIQNKLVRGTISTVAARDNGDKSGWNWATRPGAFAYNSKSAHTGYSLTIPADKSSYWMVFGVAESTEQDKWRGPFDNTQDYCYHYHGSEDDWDVYPCP
ncbi:45116_t:CDS:1, partial [Gigaspora margarita]